MRVLAQIVSLVGAGMFVFGMFGIGDTVKDLRKDTQLQGAIIDLYRSGAGSEIRARAEERLEEHRVINDVGVLSHSVVLNVFSIVIGLGLIDVPRRWAAIRREKESGTSEPCRRLTER